jgi:arylsulfatase A-like enzyme
VKEFDLEARALLDSEVVTKTSAFLKAHADKGQPFFVYVALTQIHPPFLPQSGFVGKSKSGPYADIQMQVDHNIGIILDAIAEAGVEDNTLVILTGDNAAGEQSKEWEGEGGSDGPWRGGLSTAYEGGIRTPCIIRWPEKIREGKVTDEILSDLDWFPAIAHLIGEEARIPNDRAYDGVNQADFLLGRHEKVSKHQAWGGI